MQVVCKPCKKCRSLARKAAVATSSLLPRCCFLLAPTAVCSFAFACNARSPKSGVVVLSVTELCLNKLCYCRNPLPPLFMRFTLQTLNAAPRLKGFLLDILSNLVNKQVCQLRLLSLLLDCCNATHSVVCQCTVIIVLCSITASISIATSFYTNCDVSHH